MVHVTIPPKEVGDEEVVMELDVEKDAKKVSEYFVQFTEQAKTSITESRKCEIRTEDEIIE